MFFDGVVYFDFERVDLAGMVWQMELNLDFCTVRISINEKIASLICPKTYGDDISCYSLYNLKPKTRFSQNFV